MVNRKELKDFAAYCRTKYNLPISEAVVNDYAEYRNVINQPGVEKPVKSESDSNKCGIKGIPCSHVAFNTAKCSECLN